MGKREKKTKKSNNSKVAVRSRTVIKTASAGVAVNIILAAVKFVVGSMTGSIAITSDALNNFADAGSSLVTVTGTKMAMRPADKEHPFGHGRIEYLAELVITLVIIYSGVTAMIESVKRIISPVVPEYTADSIVIVVLAVAVKAALGAFFTSRGRRFNSGALTDSGKDSFNDAIISISTILAAAIFIRTGRSLEPYLGVLIAVYIILSGFEMLRDTISKMIGRRADPSIVDEVRSTVESFYGVYRAYEIVLYDYGPDHYNGAAHIEVNENMTAEEIYHLTRSITQRVEDEYNVYFNAIGVYPHSSDPRSEEMENSIRKIIAGHDHIVQIHGFHLDDDVKKIYFDLVVDFDADDRLKCFDDAVDDVRRSYPDYEIEADMDRDYGN